MTLFRKVFNAQDDSAAVQPIRTSYDLAMAPEPEDLIAMDQLAEMLEAPDVIAANDAADEIETDTVPDICEDAVAEAQALLSAAQAAPVPAPSSQSAGRSKTRLLGFSPAADDALDPIRAVENTAEANTPTFTVGWLVVVDGAGRGAHFSLSSGVASIGRGEDQSISLDFGDTAISRQAHAALAYDPEQSKFFLGHGGKSNIIRLNDQPVLSTEAVSHGDCIRIGETTLKLIALCDETFNWETSHA